MAERTDLISITLTKYDEPSYKILKYGLGRWCLNFYKFALIFEFWFWRKK